MIQRSIVVLVIFGYVFPVVTNPVPQHPACALYAAYQQYDRTSIDQLLDRGTGSRAEQLEHAVNYAREKDKEPNKNFDNAAVAVRMQSDLIEARKSWFQRHYRLTSVGIPLLTFIVVGVSSHIIKERLKLRGGQS
ncbi:MAG: hypothetical protein ACHQVS_04945 [Candidatus Babeliales bacterium]